MLRALLIGILLTMVPCLPSRAAVPAPAKGADPAKTPWKHGEKLYYEVDFAFLTAAVAMFEVKRGKGADEMSLKLATSGVANEVYPITSKFWSRQQLRPWRSLEYGEQRNENGDVNHEKNTVDYARGEGTRERYSDKRTDTFKFRKNLYLNDLVSMNYGMRYGPWKKGDKRVFDLHEGGKIKHGDVKCLGIREMSVADWPKQRLIILEALPQGDDKGKGSLKVYLTDDKRRLPLLVKLEFAYGTADIRLVKATMPGAPTRQIAK